VRLRLPSVLAQWFGKKSSPLPNQNEPLPPPSTPPQSLPLFYNPVERLSLLSAGDLELAFLILDGQVEEPDLSPSLQNLNREDWSMLVQTLSLLMEQREHNSLH
jgi:hypothetical protein